MYVDAIFDRYEDKIKIAERVNGQRNLVEYQPHHVFYFKHDGGTHRNIYGTPCKQWRKRGWKKFQAEVRDCHRKGIPTYESDINPVFRALSERYPEHELPDLHVCFFDIETGFDPNRGFAPTDNPFSPVTAITLHQSWTDQLITLALKPPTISSDRGHEIAASFENTIVYQDEKQLLQDFLRLIEDADVLSGWNSEGYDVPYLVNRIRMLSGEDATRAFCLWDQKPREREYIKFMRTFKTYEFVGRVHLDYLLLYQKHNTQQRQSYKLDSIGEIEIGENKVPYEGTLDSLYLNDFDRFIEYSRQDVAMLVKMDRKLKYIGLANQIAHANCVLLKTTMGTVSLVDQAIINKVHEFGFVAMDRKPEEKAEVHLDEDGEPIEVERTPVVGAYVAHPKKGLHEHIGAVDINSLYPSTIRALNMSPETIMGQVRLDDTMALVQSRIDSGTPRAEAWDGLFSSVEVKAMHDRSDQLVTVDFEDGTTKRMTAAQLYGYVFDPANQVCITANGTLFRTDKEGIIPRLLAEWYAERKQLQAVSRDFEKMASGIEISPELAALLNK